MNSEKSLEQLMFIGIGMAIRCKTLSHSDAESLERIAKKCPRTIGKAFENMTKKEIRDCQFFASGASDMLDLVCISLDHHFGSAVRKKIEEEVAEVLKGIMREHCK